MITHYIVNLLKTKKVISLSVFICEFSGKVLLTTNRNNNSIIFKMKTERYYVGYRENPKHFCQRKGN